MRTWKNYGVRSGDFPSEKKCSDDDAEPVMRIDLIITELFVGGAEKCITELAVSLHDKGDRVRVFSVGSLPTGEQSQLVDRLKTAGIAVESAECDSVSRAISAYRFLKRRFTEDKPDLVQTFLHHANILGVHAARSAGISKCVAAIRVAENQRFRNHLERISLRRADHTLCVSRAVERFTKEVLKCASNRTSVIPNGVHLDQFKGITPSDWSSIGWPEDAKVILFIGRFDHQKGIDLLQEQIDSLAPAGTQQKLLLIGDGPLRDPTQQWALKMGKDRVQCLPWQSEVASWIAASELLVLPSRYEGMPNVLLEAMASAKPVVCSLVEGSEELLGPTCSIQGFKTGSGDELALRVTNLMNQEELRRELGSENRERISAHHSMPRIMDEYRNFYLSLLR
jgi:starch synthase (maltosyl-transferring)